MEVTPYEDVTVEQVKMAQYVIEIYTGRSESEVDGARDKGILARATIAQTVYMRENPETTYEQIAATTQQSGGEMTVFKDAEVSPFIAPLAILACKHLSWKNSRSIRIGRIWQRVAGKDWSRD